VFLWVRPGGKGRKKKEEIFYASSRSKRLGGEKDQEKVRILKWRRGERKGSTPQWPILCKEGEEEAIVGGKPSIFIVHRSLVAFEKEKEEGGRRIISILLGGKKREKRRKLRKEKR